MTPLRRNKEFFDGTLSDRAYRRIERLVTGEDPQTADPQQWRPRSAIFGFSRLIQACGFLSIADTFDTLNSNGVLVYLGGPMGTDMLAVLCLALAWFLFLGSAIILIPRALSGVRKPWLRKSAATTLWTLTAVGLTVFSIYGAFMTIAATTSYRSIRSPDGAHRLLIVDSSFLLLGRHVVYEPACGPLFDRRAVITTDDGYDPFKDGQFSVEWSADAATISYVFDYMDATERKNVTVPLGTDGTCG